MDPVDHVQLRPSIGLVLLTTLAVAVIAILLVQDGDGDERDRATTSQPSTTSAEMAPPSTIFAAALGPTAPSIGGALADGTPYTVTERVPGALCAEIDRAETCHHEHVDASGAMVLEHQLIFGYLEPAASSVAIRYRQTGTNNDGVRVEPDAGFFAIPISGDDPYRLQYRASTAGAGWLITTSEVPLEPLTGDPSQTTEAAVRDGVVPEVAELPFNRRVHILDEAAWPDEGPYVISRLGAAAESVGCGLGNPDGPNGPDLVCDLDDFEVLLLDDTGTKIERAYPLPGLRPAEMLVTDDALYVAGHGDGALPHSFVARIDRVTGESIVRMLPFALADGEPLEALFAS